MRGKYLVALAVIVATALPAGAAIIYHNGTPNEQGAHLSDFDGNLFVAFAEHANDFQLQPWAATITDIHWWGAYAQSNTPGVDDFTIRIYGDNGGSPNLTSLFELTNLTVSRVDSNLNIPTQTSADVYFYSVDIAPIALTPNTTYWISIINDTTSDTNDDWYWADSVEFFGNARYRLVDGGAWSAASYDSAFYLTGPVVPEPASLTMVGLGLLALAGFRNRRGSRT